MTATTSTTCVCRLAASRERPSLPAFPSLLAVLFLALNHSLSLSHSFPTLSYAHFMRSSPEKLLANPQCPCNKSAHSRPFSSRSHPLTLSFSLSLSRSVVLTLSIKPTCMHACTVPDALAEGPSLMSPLSPSHRTSDEPTDRPTGVPSARFHYALLPLCVCNAFTFCTPLAHAQS